VKENLCNDRYFQQKVAGGLGINRFQCNHSTIIRLPNNYHEIKCQPYFHRNKSLSKLTPQNRRDVCSSYANRIMSESHQKLRSFDYCSDRWPKRYKLLRNCCESRLKQIGETPYRRRSEPGTQPDCKPVRVRNTVTVHVSHEVSRGFHRRIAIDHEIHHDLDCFFSF